MSNGSERMRETSPTAEIREAARLIRLDADGSTDLGSACDSIALLLENEANAWEAQDARNPDGDFDLAVNHARRSLLTGVARAYLGRP